MPERDTNSKIVMLRGERNVIDEVEIICKNMKLSDKSFIKFKNVFDDIILLFKGQYTGYRACNTPYHNLQHTLDCLLAMVRLIHGAYLTGVAFSEKQIQLGLISSVLHDTGYIQKDDDIDGTGAKYTMIHVRRSIDFSNKYLILKGFSMSDVKFCENCVRYTALNQNYSTIDFGSENGMIIGKMLATADLAGQMADPAYLEKLSFLAIEFEEAKVPGFISEADLMNKTLSFHLENKERFTNEFGNAVSYFRNHFKERWNIDKDLYSLYTNKQMDYLSQLIEKHPDDYSRHLKRKI